MKKIQKYILVIFLLAVIGATAPDLYVRLLEKGCINLDYWGWYEGRQPALKYDPSKLSSDEQDILTNFSEVAPAACEAFFTDTKEEFIEYEAGLDDRFKVLSAHIKKDVKDSLDGIKSRASMSAAEKREALALIYTQNYVTFLHGTISDLEKIRDDNLHFLNERVLTNISLNPRFRINSSKAIQEIDLTPIVGKLDSKFQLVSRVGEEAISSIPVVGDAYDIGRIFYDPRFDRFVGNDLDNTIENLKNNYRRSVFPVIKDRIMPSTDLLNYKVRSNFIPDLALAKLNREG